MGERRKVYVAAGDGAQVPFTEVTLDGENPPFRLYDSSGPEGVDPAGGLLPLRSPWIHGRDDVEHYAGRAPTLRDDGRGTERAGHSGAEAFAGPGATRPRLRAA